jgi:FixJ family two-component response regulator
MAQKFASRCLLPTGNSELTIQPAKVIVVDDDDSVRRSLRRLLTGVGYEVEEFGSAEEFLNCSSRAEPACAVLDLAMPGMDGLALQQELVRTKLPLGLVFLSGHGDIPASVAAIKHGAVDFLTKPVDEVVLLRAIESALEFAREQAGLSNRFVSLSPRELQVMHHVVNGVLNKHIAVELGISEKTVKVHRAHLMEKTDVRSLAELVQICTKAGIS